MKVLFFEPYTLALPHYETAMELMQLHAEQNDDIILYHCNANLSFCESNPKHNYNQCMSCISRRLNGLSLLDINLKIKNFKNINRTEIEFIRNDIPQFETIHSLKKYYYEGVDIGYATASSLISQVRDPEPNMQTNRVLVEKILRSAFSVYFSFKRILKKEKPDVVYIFNGRFANLRVVLRLCQQMGIECRIHERGADKSKYSITSNHLPHEIEPFVQRVLTKWDSEQDIIKRDKIARDFYEKRKAGAEQGWFSYVTNQEPNRLPENWDTTKRNIIIFNSSEDEFASIGEDFHCKPFENQLDAIKFIKQELNTDSSINIYLRMHPNLKDVDNISVSQLYSLSSNNFFVIEPDSPISTYKLIDACDLVVTFGSTTGAEATYWRKPSLLIGSTFYQSLNIAHQVSTKEELIEKIKSYNEVKPIEDCLKYGFHSADHGIPYKYYQAEKLFKGTYQGKQIGINNLFIKIINKRPFVYVTQWLFNRASI